MAEEAIFSAAGNPSDDDGLKFEWFLRRLFLRSLHYPSILQLHPDWDGRTAFRFETERLDSFLQMYALGRILHNQELLKVRMQSSGEYYLSMDDRDDPDWEKVRWIEEERRALSDIFERVCRVAFEDLSAGTGQDKKGWRERVKEANLKRAEEEGEREKKTWMEMVAQARENRAEAASATPPPAPLEDLDLDEDSIQDPVKKRNFDQNTGTGVVSLLYAMNEVRLRTTPSIRLITSRLNLPSQQ